MKATFAHADTCLPDYWSGHHLPHIMVPVWRGMRINDIRSMIRSELSQGAIMGNSDDARLLSFDLILPEEVKRADRLTKAAYAAVNKIKLAGKKRKLFMGLEESDENSESVYAYFVLVIEE